MKDIRRMYVPSGKKNKNSTTRKRSTRKGYKSPSNKSINTLSNPNYSNTGNIMYRKGIKNIIGSGHQSVNESGGDFKQTQPPQELSTLNCRCTKINNCDELFGELLCNICSDFESFILNQSNYAYSDGQAYCEYEFPAICDDDGNCGNNLCDFSCSSDGRAPDEIDETYLNITYKMPIRNGSQLSHPQTAVDGLADLVARNGYSDIARDIRETMLEDMTRYINWSQEKLNSIRSLGTPMSIDLSDYVNEMGGIRNCGGCPGGMIGNCPMNWCVSGGSWSPPGGGGWNSEGNEFSPGDMKLNWVPKYQMITISIYF